MQGGSGRAWKPGGGEGPSPTTMSRYDRPEGSVTSSSLSRPCRRAEPHAPQAVWQKRRQRRTCTHAASQRTFSSSANAAGAALDSAAKPSRASACEAASAHVARFRRSRGFAPGGGQAAAAPATPRRPARAHARRAVRAACAPLGRARVSAAAGARSARHTHRRTAPAARGRRRTARQTQTRPSLRWAGSKRVVANVARRWRRAALYNRASARPRCLTRKP